MTTVDILMPYYGDASLMRDAVRSVLAQEDPSWHLTVVDDGTEEGVAEWFAELGDDRVRYLRNDHNLGVTGNFNRCLELVEHELVVLMGCDDLMLPGYVGTVRSVHKDMPDADIIQPGVQVVDGAGAPVKTLADEVKRRIYAPKIEGRLAMSGEKLAVSLLRGDWLYFPALCWKAEAITSVRFRAEWRVIQDLALLIELIQQGASLAAVDTVCFKYRRHIASESSATAVHGSRFEEAENYFVGVAAQMRAHGWHKAARVAQLHLSSRLFALTMLPQALRRPDRSGASVLARHALIPSRRTPS